MAVFYALNAFIHFAFLEEAASALGVAVIHTAFNVAAVIIIFPVSWILEKLAYLTIPETEEEREKEAEKSRKEIQLLDTRFLSTPGFALEQCKNVAVDMADSCTAQAVQECGCGHGRLFQGSTVPGNPDAGQV